LLFREGKKMPDGLVPVGYRAVLLGATGTIEEMSALAPLEESAGEGALMLMQLDFVSFLSGDTLSQLEEACRDAGMPAWPGRGYIVNADVTRPTVYLAWQKGMAWLPIIIGILVTVVLPPLLGSLIWLILPEPVKQLITGLIQMGMMLLVMWLMMSLIKPLTAPEKPKRLEEARR
jgi:hypothetical protein